MTELRFTALGHPQAKGSTRAFIPRGSNRPITTDANPRTAPWEVAIATAAHEAANGGRPVDCGVVVTLSFYFQRPRGHYGTGRNAGTLKASAPAAMTTKPDVDKLARAALDALTGVVVADDRQVFALHARKLYGAPERLEAVIRTL